MKLMGRRKGQDDKREDGELDMARDMSVALNRRPGLSMVK